MAPRLEVNEDVNYEKKAWVVQRTAWVLMFFVVAASVAGVLGPGLFSEKQAGDSSFRIEYERVLRNGRATTVKIHIAGTQDAADRVVQLIVDKTYFEDMYVQSITPEPESEEAGTDLLAFSFTRIKAGVPIMVEFQMKPQTARRASGTFSLSGGSGVRIRQLVLP